MTVYRVTYEIDERIDPTGIDPDARNLNMVCALIGRDARREDRAERASYLVESDKTAEELKRFFEDQLGEEDLVHVLEIQRPGAE